MVISKLVGVDIPVVEHASPLQVMEQLLLFDLILLITRIMRIHNDNMEK